MKSQKLSNGYLKPDFVFNPASPDKFESFKWDLAPFSENVKLDWD